MIRRLFTLGAVISLLLFVGAMVLWVRSRSKADLWEVVTPGRIEWQFGSSPSGWTLAHLAAWPDAPGTRHASYTYADPRDLKEHSLAVLSAISPGTFVRDSTFLGMSFQHGRLCTLVGSDGTVIRVPPSPPGSVLKYASTPLPYWSVSFPGWLLPTALFLFPCGVLFLRARTWIRSGRRRKRGLCECCGYDLREITDRCPECGTPIPAKS